MANNYLMFSEVFESVAPEEAAWVKRVLLDLDDLPDDELKIHQKWLDDQLFAPNAGRDAGWDWYEQSWPGFLCQPCGDGIWIHDDGGHGNVEHVEMFVSALLRRFRPDGIFKLTWAETCSQPRIGEFGGGAMVVTSKKTHWLNAHFWAFKKTREIENDGG